MRLNVLLTLTSFRMLLVLIGTALALSATSSRPNQRDVAILYALAPEVVHSSRPGPHGLHGSIDPNQPRMGGFEFYTSCNDRRGCPAAHLGEIGHDQGYRRQSAGRSCARPRRRIRDFRRRGVRGAYCRHRLRLRAGGRAELMDGISADIIDAQRSASQGRRPRRSRAFEAGGQREASRPSTA